MYLAGYLFDGGGYVGHGVGTVRQCLSDGYLLSGKVEVVFIVDL